MSLKPFDYCSYNHFEIYTYNIILQIPLGPLLKVSGLVNYKKAVAYD
jgi:hypothetical protein